MGCKGLHCPGCSSGGGGGNSAGPVIALVLLVIGAAVIARSARAIRHGADEVGHVLTIAALVIAVMLAVAVAAGLLTAFWLAGRSLYRWHRRRVLAAPLRLVDARTPAAVDVGTAHSLAAGWRSIARPVSGRALPRPNGAPAREAGAVVHA